MLSISITLANTFIPKLRSVVETSSSTKAIYAADAASEVCLFESRHQAVPVSRPFLTNGATFTIASLSATPVDVSNDCRVLGGVTFRFRALGTFGGVSRALEVSQ